MTRPRKPRLPPMSERALQTFVVKLAMLRGWLVHHGRPGWTSRGWRTPLQGHKGFLDTVLAREPLFLIVECKSQRGRLTPEQEQWVAVLRACRLDVRVWRPSDLPEIEKTLA